MEKNHLSGVTVKASLSRHLNMDYLDIDTNVNY